LASIIHNVPLVFTIVGGTTEISTALI